MDKLLALAVDAHGGLDVWNKFESLHVHVPLGVPFGTSSKFPACSGTLVSTSGSATNTSSPTHRCVKRAIKSGYIHKDLDPLVGVANVSASPDWPQSARRLVDILITGSRPIR